MSQGRSPNHSTNSTNLADLLERVLDKGVVIAGDVKIKLVDIELLSIQLRLVICSVDKAKEMGMDWWVNHPLFEKPAPKQPELVEQRANTAEPKMLESMEQRLMRLEKLLTDAIGDPNAGAATATSAAPMPIALSRPVPPAA
jgi:hypothetical protein